MAASLDPSGARRLRPGPLLATLLLLVVLGFALAGCDRNLSGALAPDQRPTVRLTFAPVDTSQAEFYVYRMYWTGFDADGRVVRYEYAVDPPGEAGADTPWVATTRSEEEITFSAPVPEETTGIRATSRGFHVFVVRAVDNRGLRSAPVARAFYSFGVAPIVQILSPWPASLLTPIVPPNTLITWTGSDFTDPTGTTASRPLYYKYRLFARDADPRWTRWLTCPDSMRLDFAPAFAGWDSTGPDSAFARYTGLSPNTDYLLVVVAFGRSGAYSPIWSQATNMLRFSVGAGMGPVLTLYSSFFTYSYLGSGFPWPGSSWLVELEIPSGDPLTFHWFGTPAPGGPLSGYRWVLDPANLDDETPRSGPADVSHWSAWSLATTSATVGPFAGTNGTPAESHDFYVQVRDVNGMVGMGGVRFAVIRPTWERDLLIVDDTRLRVDQFVRGRTDTLLAPTGNWPTRAELDTFLFAVGGVRWRMTPDGTVSRPGLFHGYAFDTLGTRRGLANPTIPLSVLGQYRHVIWMVDQTGSYYGGSPPSAITPMTTLNYMSKPNRQNTLATWVSQGGSLWALGGGFGNATNVAWNQTANDLNGVVTYTSLVTPAAPTADLVPGRFMYDLAHWRSEFRVFEGFIRIARTDQADPTSAAAGAWPGAPLRQASYYELPVALQARNPATDPISLWPYRTPSGYYINDATYSDTGIQLEFLSLANHVNETTPGVPGGSAALDTLYLAYAPAYSREMLQAGQGANVMMTYYHGSENGSVLFQGTNIWHYRATQCQQLADVVLRDLWGLSKSAMPAPSRLRATGRR
jgi:hypothetical protein